MATSEDDEVGQENADLRPALGAKLKTAREAQDLSIEEIAAELRIGVPFLTALEEGQYATLGAPVFAKGYLKQYGARLSLDISELVAEYDQAVGHQSIEIAPSRTIKLRDERLITVWIVAALVLVGIGAIIWFWWWLGTDRDEPPAEIPVDDEVAAVAEVTAIEVPSQAVPVAGATEQTSIPDRPDAEIALPLAAEVVDDDFDSREALDPDAILEAEIAVAPVPVPSAADAPAPAAAPDLTAAVEAYSGPELTINFVADSWTEITAESGDRLFYNLGRAGSSATVPADRDMNLFFGNAAGVELTLQGEPYAIPATARRRGNTAQWELAGRDEAD